MRCLSCDKRLNNAESTRKYASTGGFVDLCNHCFKDVAEDIPAIDGAPVLNHPDEDSDYQPFAWEPLLDE